jgi:hypothetical protein
VTKARKVLKANRVNQVFRANKGLSVPRVPKAILVRRGQQVPSFKGHRVNKAILGRRARRALPSKGLRAYQAETVSHALHTCPLMLLQHQLLVLTCLNCRVMHIHAQTCTTASLFDAPWVQFLR